MKTYHSAETDTSEYEPTESTNTQLELLVAFIAGNIFAAVLILITYLVTS